MFFANLAIECKRRAPNARTFLEIIRVRYGTVAHLSFMPLSRVNRQTNLAALATHP